MPVLIQTEFDQLLSLPDYVDAHHLDWNALGRPHQAEEHPSHGIKGNTYYNNDFMFSISIPSNVWYFWQPTTAFKITLGPMASVPGRSMPIMILSRQAHDLFRPNISVTVEDVGDFTKFEEMIKLSILLTEAAGANVDREKDVRIDDEHNSGLIGFTQPWHSGKTLCTTQRCYLSKGRFYTITATYVAISSENKKPCGSLQEILNSFKFLDA